MYFTISVVEYINEPQADLNFDIRAKTSSRMQYEAQAKVIMNRIGNLEEIRQRLGLSKRKISQLLMIDPSTWIRWTSYGDPIPPHIYRALDWYLSAQAVQVIKAEVQAVPADEDTQKKLQELEQSIKNARVGLVMMAISAMILAFAFYRTLKGL